MKFWIECEEFGALRLRSRDTGMMIAEMPHLGIELTH
jgi:hypothetical protein